MKRILTSIAAGGLLAMVAAAQPAPRYSIIELGAIAGPFSQATGVSDNRYVTGISSARDGNQHAALWVMGLKIDLGTPGLNSGAFGINPSGQIPIQAETTAKDPNNANFCAYGTGRQCRPFLLQGVMTALPLLGGYNGTVGNSNNRGEVAGIAENGTRDPACPSEPSLSGTGPQVLDFEPVVWGPKAGDIRELRRLPGDTVGMALWINDNGQAVGATGTCANTTLPPVAFGPHAVYWEKDGSPVDMGNLGGKVVNIGLAINNKGQAVGVSSLNDKSSPNFQTNAFLWTKGTGMRDLGTLPGDVASVGAAINERGDVVGFSFDKEGSPRATFWRDGFMSDLNDLIPGNSPLYLLLATSINSSGEIAGFGAVKSTCMGDPELCEVHGFLASPNSGTSSRAPDTVGGRLPFVLPENVRAALRQRMQHGK
ncbi:MAG: hypothetical protein JWP63_3384 [Candidatus Solibacter sp.]|nr:hypothetical protein [Candidatus Solibacter sp.]